MWAVIQNVSWGQIATYWLHRSTTRVSLPLEVSVLRRGNKLKPPSTNQEHLGDDSPDSFQRLEYLAAALVGRLSRMRCDWIGSQIFFRGGNLQICHHLSFRSGLYCTVCWLCCVAFSVTSVCSSSFCNEHRRLIKLCIIMRLHLPSQPMETFLQSRLKIKSLIEKQKE